jgi:hypothetical protein
MRIDALRDELGQIAYESLRAAAEAILTSLKRS